MRTEISSRHIEIWPGKLYKFSQRLCVFFYAILFETTTNPIGSVVVAGGQYQQLIAIFGGDPGIVECSGFDLLDIFAKYSLILNASF